MPVLFEANVMQKARELMADFQSLTRQLPQYEENRIFQEFVLMKLAELTLTAQSLRSARFHSADAGTTAWAPRVQIRARKRMMEFDDLSPDLGGEG